MEIHTICQSGLSFLAEGYLVLMLLTKDSEANKWGTKVMVLVQKNVDDRVCVSMHSKGVEYGTSKEEFER